MATPDLLLPPMVENAVGTGPLTTKPLPGYEEGIHGEQSSMSGRWEYIITFVSILLYFCSLISFIVFYGKKECVVSKEEQRNIIPAFWGLFGFVILVGIGLVFAIAKGMKITKWPRFFLFVFHFIVFVFSILLYIFFKNERCDDKNKDTTGDAHASINVILDVLMISSSVMMIGTLTSHMHHDCNC